MQKYSASTTEQLGSGLPYVKKCASLLGVGLHLYADRLLRPGAAGRPQRVAEKPAATSVSGGGAVTPRQLEAIAKVANAKGLDPTAVQSMSLRVFNRKPEALTQADAARLIKELSNLKRSAA